MDEIELIKKYIAGAEEAMREGERIILRAEGARQALTQLLADIEALATPDEKEPL